MLPNVMVISDSTQTDNLENTLKQCIDYGAEWIAVREHDSTTSELESLLSKLIRYTENTNIILSIWNNPLTAEKIGLGLHLPSDKYNCEFKNRLDFDKPLGKSCHNENEIVSANNADYITLSPVFDSISKVGYSGMGIDKFSRLIPYAHQPVYGLGGIDSSNAEDVLEAGAYGIACCGYVMQNPKLLKNILELF